MIRLTWQIGTSPSAIQSYKHMRDFEMIRYIKLYATAIVGALVVAVCGAVIAQPEPPEEWACDQLQSGLPEIDIALSKVACKNGQIYNIIWGATFCGICVAPAEPHVIMTCDWCFSWELQYADPNVQPLWYEMVARGCEGKYKGCSVGSSGTAFWETGDLTYSCPTPGKYRAVARWKVGACGPQGEPCNVSWGDSEYTDYVWV